MIKSLEYIKLNGVANLEALSKGEYHKSMPPKKEETLVEDFINYKMEKSCQV